MTRLLQRRAALAASVVLVASCAGRGAVVSVVRSAAPAEIEVPLVMIRVADDDGTRAARIGEAEILTWIEEAQLAYRTAGVRPIYARRAEIDLVRDTFLNNAMDDNGLMWWLARDRGNAISRRFPGRIVVFVRHGPGQRPGGGGFVAPDADFIVMPASGVSEVCGRKNVGLLAHELGHYLGLGHTFARSFETLRQAERYLVAHHGDLAVFDGDRLADTPPLPHIQALQCAGTTRIVLAGRTLELSASNLMSYSHHGKPGIEERTLTRAQIRIVRATLRDRLRGRPGTWPRRPPVRGSGKHPATTLLNSRASCTESDAGEESFHG